MKYYKNISLEPSFNMAFDEMMLKSDSFGNESIFGIWRDAPAVIIGLNQVAEQEVNFEYSSKNNIPVIRRTTGGGAVYHDFGNLNYSFFFSNSNEQDSYDKIFELMYEAFLAIGLEIDHSSTNDILYKGKKFSGMAKRRYEDRVLIHGTLLYDVDFDVLSNVLDNQKGKFNQKHGIESRHAEVVNLKPFLNDINSIEELAIELERFFSNGYSDEQIVINEDFKQGVRKLAASKYKPIEYGDI